MPEVRQNWPERAGNLLEWWDEDLAWATARKADIRDRYADDWLLNPDNREQLAFNSFNSGSLHSPIGPSFQPLLQAIKTPELLQRLLDEAVPKEITRTEWMLTKLQAQAESQKDDLLRYIKTQEDILHNQQILLNIYNKEQAIIDRLAELAN